MKKQAFNPYLPSWEYVPDGEPHRFGERIYVYGSHDRFNGYAYCLNDYVCYSAPVDDLADWHYEGVIYARQDDPLNPDGDMTLFAPDVTQGPDGRYYLYYVLNRVGVVSVAVSDTPAGHYHFYGHVHYPDGTPLGSKAGDEPQFDPGVLTEGKDVYLYTGFCMPDDAMRHGAMVTKLNADMLTVELAPQFIVPSVAYGVGTAYAGHEFFEASSIRKIHETYYFVYSSAVSHELCYATSTQPMAGFSYGGVIVSNNDMHISSYKPADMPGAYGGNNHGGLVQAQDQWYVFYHRHTNGTNFSRQGLIEPITINADGSIPQVEMTSSGANNGPLRGVGEYPAYIACNLWTKTPAANVGAPGDFMNARFPRITQEGADGDENLGYVANLRDGAVVGFKYFDCAHSRIVSITTRGSGNMTIAVATSWDGPTIGECHPQATTEWRKQVLNIEIPDGAQALYFRVKGSGITNIQRFSLSDSK